MSAADPLDHDDRTELIELERRLSPEVKIAEPTAAARTRLLDAVEDAGRFERFVPAVAGLADVSETTARGWLDGVWGEVARWEPAAPMARAWWVEGGPRAANALRGFVHVAAGHGLPHHRHLGDEHVLVLQGCVKVTTGERLHAGESMRTPAGDEHAFEVVPGGPDLLVFTVAYSGLDFGSFVARPR